MKIGSTPITDIKIGSTQITKVISNGITYWEVTTTTISPTTTVAPTTTTVGETYYVKNGGNDSLSGLDDTNAWATISKINGRTFNPDDQVLFKCNSVWRETLEVPNSGVPSGYITFGNYGTGNNPRFLGSGISSGWTDQGGNIWKSDSTFTSPRTTTADIHFNSSGVITWGSYKTTTGGLVSEYDWTWSANYIYVYAATSPATRYTSVEIPQRNAIVDTWHHEYLHFNGIDLFYGSSIGFDSNSFHSDHIDTTGCIIENCEVGHMGGITTTQAGYGLAVIYTDLVVRNCTIHNCGRRGISLDIYNDIAAGPFTATNALIENNTFHTGFHTTSIDVSVGSGSYTGSWNDITFRNNLVYESETATMVTSSNQIFLQNYDQQSGPCTLSNVKIYNNIFKFTTGSSVMIEATQSTYIYNNVFYGHNTQSASTHHVWIDGYSNAVTIKNNIFYTLLASTTGSAIFTNYNVDEVNQMDVDYNTYYRINNTLMVWRINATDNYYMNDLTTVQSLLGWDTNSIMADPSFASAPSNLHLLSTSVAVNAGTTPLSLTDYEGVTWDGTPNIGAYQNTVAVTTTVAPTTTYYTTTAAPTTTSAPFVAEYQTVYNAMTNKPSAPVASAQNTMVQALVTASIWSKLDLFYCLAQYTNNAGEAYLNWINPATFTCTNVSSTVFTSLEGFTGDHSADYLNTNWTPSTNAVHYSLNSGSIGVYCRINDAYVGNIMGASGVSRLSLGPYESDIVYARINSSTSSAFSSGYKSQLGLTIVSRTASNVVACYKNNVHLTDVTTASVALPNGTFRILQDPYNPEYSATQISFVFVGAGLSLTECGVIYTAVEVYMDSNGKGVI